MQLKPGPIRTVHRRCPLCDSDNRTHGNHRYSDPGWRLKACPDCGFVYIENAPAYEHLSTDAPWEVTTQTEAARRAATRGREYRLSKLTRWRLHLLPRRRFADLLLRHARPGNVVDVGCGDGFQLRELPAGYVPHGVEVSAALWRSADALFRQSGGYAVHAPALEGLRRFPDGFFTAATLRSYLEHEMQPLAVLQEVRRTLQPGGVALVKVPNYGSLNRRLRGRNWCGFRFPEHLNYFTPASLRNMGEDAGFRVRCGPIDRLPTSDNLYAVLTRPPAPGRR